jgi:hypothetical protein
MRIPGIGSIDVDRSGTLMRLRIADRDPHPVVDAVRAVLGMEGYRGEPLAGEEEQRATQRIETWHGTAADLSREEARVLAAEISTSFARERATGAAASELVRRTIGERLYESFTAPDAASHVGSLITRAVPAIVSEARTYLGSDDAAALEAFLERWPKGGSANT